MQSQDLTSDDTNLQASQAVTAKPVHQHLVRTRSSSGTRGSSGRRRGQPVNDMYMLPAEYTSIPDRPEVGLHLIALLQTPQLLFVIVPCIHQR